MRQILKSKIVRFPFHRFCESLSAPNVRSDGSEYCARCAGKDGGTEGALHPFRGMILLSVTHLVCEDDGNLVLVRQIVVETNVDAHIVSERAECVEALVIIDEVIVRAVVNRGIRCADRCGEI